MKDNYYTNSREVYNGLTAIDIESIQLDPSSFMPLRK